MTVEKILDQALVMLQRQGRAPLAYTPPYLAEKILTSRRALEGERKQGTVLFADLKGSMELLADCTAGWTFPSGYPRPRQCWRRWRADDGL